MQPVFDFSTIAARTNLGVMETDIPDAGRGLYTYDRIREGKTVCEYFGMEVIKDFDYGEINDLISSYSMGNHDDSIIYCAFHIPTQAMLCMAGYINDPLDDNLCNVRPIWNGNRCRIVAVRDIEPGEQLLMAYGDTYWMRDIWSSDIIGQAWDNYGLDRTNARWSALFRMALSNEADAAMEAEAAMEPESEVESEITEESLWEEDWEEEEDEERVVFPESIFREIIDLTQGDEPRVIMEEVAVLPAANAEEPEEEYVVVRNSCA